MKIKKLSLNKIHILILMVVLILIPSTSKADIGPKPSVRVKITGLDENTSYYMTLISQESNYPWEGYELENYSSPEGKLASFEDEEGYKYIGHYEELEGNDTYVWGYYPPRRF